MGDLDATQIANGDSPGFLTATFPTGIRNGTGADFAVFENGFNFGTTPEGGPGLFAEFAFVEVSSNGTDFARFPSISTNTGPLPGGFGSAFSGFDVTNVFNLAGKHAGGFGTPFDLDDLLTDPLVSAGDLDLNNIQFVRLVDIPGNGAFTDSLGNPIFDNWLTQGTGGFDFRLPPGQGIGVINNIVPTPGSLAIFGLGGLAAARRRRTAATIGAVAVLGGTATAQAVDPWADRVVSYDQGNNPAAGFTDPTTALGSPTRSTNPTSPFGGAVTPFQAAFGTDEIVSIGEGGHLTVAFDEPVRNDAGNPFGLDLLIFGNAFYVDTAFPNGVAGGLFAEGGSISVSSDGINFFDVLNVDADGAFPTLGFLDPTGPVTVFGQGPVTGTIESDFTKPVDPSFDPTGLPFAEILAGYDGSGGGVGIDIGLLGLSEISFVRIDNPLGSGVTPEIDGFSDVAVPAPSGAFALACGSLVLMRRRRATD